MIRGESVPEEMAERLGLEAPPVEEALTNKDYFWDWEED